MSRVVCWGSLPEALLEPLAGGAGATGGKALPAPADAGRLPPGIGRERGGQNMSAPPMLQYRVLVSEDPCTTLHYMSNY